MKKLIIFTATFCLPFLADAQDKIGTGIDKELFNICSSIFVLAIVMVFILKIIRRVMDYRIKNKIIENGIPDGIVANMLHTSNKDDKNVNIKWFAIIAGLSVGFALCDYFSPLGIHSLAIMLACISLSFLGYYFFLRQTEK